jgi:archaellum component FlaC
LVLDVTLKSPSELHFRIAILQKDGDRVGGAAYVTDGAMKSPPKVFHIYPGDQRQILYENNGFKYLCVYYGTMVDRPIDAIMGRNKIPDVVPWKLYASLGAETARVEENWKTANGKLETANGELDRVKEQLKTANGELDSMKGQLQTANGELDSVKGQLQTANGELDSVKGQLETANGELDSVKEQLKTANEEVNGLKTANEMLEKANEESTKEIDRLKAIAKAVVDAIEGLKTYDNNRNSTIDKNKASTTDNDGTSTAAKEGTSTAGNKTSTTANNETPTIDGGNNAAGG